MVDLTLVIEGNLQIGRELTGLARALAEGSSELRQAEVGMASHAAQIAAGVTPWVTGSLASAHAVFVEGDETYVAISELARNPFSDEDPYQYGPEVHELGGISDSGHERAFYEVVIRDYGDVILDEAEDDFIVSLGVFT